MAVKNSPNDLVKAIEQYLTMLGWFVWRNNTGAAKMPSGRLVRFGVPGAADVIGCKPPDGRMVAVEGKTGTGRMSKAQRAWRDRFVAAGGLFVECRDVAELARMLEEAP
jgi:hypothetical protein